MGRQKVGTQNLAGTIFVEPAGRASRITPQGTVSLRRAPQDQQEADR